jgi:hypothetical protein
MESPIRAVRNAVFNFDRFVRSRFQTFVVRRNLRTILGAQKDPISPESSEMGMLIIRAFGRGK